MSHKRLNLRITNELHDTSTVVRNPRWWCPTEYAAAKADQHMSVPRLDNSVGFAPVACSRVVRWSLRLLVMPRPRTLPRDSQRMLAVTGGIGAHYNSGCIFMLTNLISGSWASCAILACKRTTRHVRYCDLRTTF